MARGGHVSSSTRILFYDIETAFSIGGYFGRTYDTNIAKVVQQGYVMGFAYKFKGDKKVQSCYIWDFPRYKKEPRNDIEVIKRWHELMSNSDLAVGHNSNSFDNKIMMGRVLVHGLEPFPMPQLADTLKMARKVARFDSNKLDDLGEMLGLGRKLHTDIDLWWDCMQGVPKAQKRMVKYNKQDVELTEKLYLRLRAFDVTHPNMARIANRPDACPTCEAEDMWLSKGFKYTRTGKRRRWQCKNCGATHTSRQSEKDSRPNYT